MPTSPFTFPLTADLCRSQDFVDIVSMLDKRLNDKGKYWRHVYKVRFVPCHPLLRSLINIYATVTRGGRVSPPQWLAKSRTVLPRKYLRHQDPQRIPAYRRLGPRCRPRCAHTRS